MSFEQVVAVGGFDKEQKITSFTSNSTPDFSVRNSKFELKNARCFKFKDEESEGLFETTIFKNCGNEYLNGGVANYKQGIKFNGCEFLDCTANVGGAVYSYYFIKDSFVGCTIVNCISNVLWSNDYSCGLYTQKCDYKFIVNCIIDSDISIYYIGDCDGGDGLPDNRLIMHSKIVGYLTYHDCKNGDWLATLDDISVELSGADDRSSKNYQSDDIADWSND